MTPVKTEYFIASKLGTRDLAYAFIPEDKSNTNVITKTTQVKIEGRSIFLIVISYSDANTYIVMNHSVSTFLNLSMNLSTTFKLTHQSIIFNNSQLYNDFETLKAVRRILYFVFLSIILLMIFFGFVSFMCNSNYKCCRAFREESTNPIVNDFPSFTPNHPGIDDDQFDDSSHSDEHLHLRDLGDDAEVVETNSRVSRKKGNLSPYLEALSPSTNPYLQQLNSANSFCFNILFIVFSFIIYVNLILYQLISINNPILAKC